MQEHLDQAVGEGSNKGKARELATILINALPQIMRRMPLNSEFSKNKNASPVWLRQTPDKTNGDIHHRGSLITVDRSIAPPLRHDRRGLFL